MRVRYGGVRQRDARFIGFRSAGEIGIDVFFRESHELLLLSEEIIEIRTHRYVHKGEERRGVVEYTQGEKERRVGLNNGGSHQGAMGRISHVTFFSTTYSLAGLGKFNIDDNCSRGLHTQREG